MEGKHFYSIDYVQKSLSKHWTSEWQYTGISCTLTQKSIVVYRTVASYINYPPEGLGLTLNKLDHITNPSTDFFNYQYQPNPDNPEALFTLTFAEYPPNTTIYVWVKYKENSTASYVNSVYLYLLQFIQDK